MAATITILSTVYGQSLAAVFAHMDGAAPHLKGISADLKRDILTAIVDDTSHLMGTIKLRHDKGETRVLIDTSPVQMYRDVRVRPLDRKYLLSENQDRPGL